MSNKITSTHNPVLFAFASRKTNVNYTPGGKALLAVCVIAQITAAIFMTLGFLNIFGPLNSIGFYAAVGSGAFITGLTIMTSILYCRIRQPFLANSPIPPGRTATNSYAKPNQQQSNATSNSSQSTSSSFDLASNSSQSTSSSFDLAPNSSQSTAPQTVMNNVACIDPATAAIDPATAANYISALYGDGSYIVNSNVTIVQLGPVSQ